MANDAENSRSGGRRREAASRTSTNSTSRASQSRSSRQSARRGASKPKRSVSWSQAKPYDRRALILRLVTCVAVAVAVLLSLSVFFRVETVQVSGNVKYTPENVLAASGIEQGSGLLTFGRTKAAGKIREELPYVKEVQVGIKLPNTVNIDIVENDVAYAIEGTDGSWWLMTQEGKLLEQIQLDAVSGYSKVVGVCAGAPKVGSVLTPGDPDAQEGGETVQASTPKERAAAVLEILPYLEKNGLMDQVTQVDVSGLYDLRLACGTQYDVRLGGPTELAYKVAYLAQVLTQLESYQTGIIDLTLEESRAARFISN